MTSGTDMPLTPTSGDAARELRRPRDGRVLAGVAAGLAEYFGLRPAIYRIAFAALALVGGAGILLYVVAALVIPAEGAEESIAEEFLRRHRDRPALLIGLAVAAVLLIGIVSSPGHAWGWPLAGPLPFLLLVALAALALWHVSQRDRARRAADGTAPRSLFVPGLGLLVAVAGALLLLDVLDWAEIPLGVVVAAGVVLVGVLIAVGAFFHRAAGLVPLGLVLAAVVSATALAGLGPGGPIGERTYRPASVEELRDEYRVRIGRLELDLSRLELPPGDTAVEVKAGLGEILVLVPPEVAVDATADAGAGDVRVLGRVPEDGWDTRERVVDRPAGGSDARLVIDAHVGAGEIEIARAP